MHKVIEPEVIAKAANLSAPHTAHCLATGEIMISMLGDAKGNGPGGFLLLDDKFEPKGRWEKDSTGMNFNYDFWYQPRHNVMVSSEWGAPKTFQPGPSFDDVAAGKYGQKIHLWDWKERKIRQSFDLGAAADPAGSAVRPRPGQGLRVRRRGAQQHDVAVRPADADR